MSELRFRQIHLDFHTSESIKSIAAEFDAEEFAKTLKEAHVNSVTCFSKCHHGWSYHDTKIGKRHPGLAFELLPSQIEACHKEGIKVPIYLSVGWDELAARENPQWRVVHPEGKINVFEPKWKDLCLNTAYSDYIISQTEEVVKKFDGDGIFLDILIQWDCCCEKCLKDMYDKGLNAAIPQERLVHQKQILFGYYQKIVNMIHSIKPN